MARPFSIAYDDFSGGHYVDRVAAKQPRNTWRGANLVAELGTGYLMPTGRWVWDTDTELTDVAAGVVNYNLVYVFRPASPDGKVVSYSLSSWPPASYTATTVTGAGNTPTGVPVVFDDSIVCADGIDANLWVYNLTTGITSYPTVPEQLSILCPFGAFLLGAVGDISSPNQNRLYYSAPMNVASWTSSDYYDIGPAQSYITALVVHNGALYIGTESGWYVASGVPGETFSVRELNDYPARAGGAVDGDTRVITKGLQWAMFEEIAGTYVGGMNYETGPLTPARTTRFVQAVDGDTVWVYDLPTRSWHCATTTDGATINTVLGSSGSSGYDQYLIGISNGKTARYEAFPATCGYDGTAFYEATATLAEYQHARPFVVRRVLAEVEFDVDPSVITAERSISVRVRTQGHLDADPANTDPSTTTLAKAWTGIEGEGQVVVVPFIVNDTPSTYIAEPEVTLKGVKLRRLIMECMEVEG